MGEELEKQNEVNSSIETSTSEKVEETTKLDSLLRLEEMRRTEKEVRTAPAIQGVSEVESEVDFDTKEFAKKSDQRKAFLKKRLKVVTGVYLSVVAMLLVFVVVNLFTLNTMSGLIEDNTKVITEQQQLLDGKTIVDSTLDGAQIEVNLNPPRDYDDEKVELTFLDKITILFRNLFG
ncbi:MAG: hypothetical protein ACLRFL_02980 [Clostridia bacterium]